MREVDLPSSPSLNIATVFCILSALGLMSVGFMVPRLYAKPTGDANEFIKFLVVSHTLLIKYFAFRLHLWIGVVYFL